MKQIMSNYQGQDNSPAFLHVVPCMNQGVEQSELAN
jgi:hypothetical protein